MKKFIQVPEMLQTPDPMANGAGLIRGIETIFAMGQRLTQAFDHETQEGIATAFVREHGVVGAVALQADIMSLQEGAAVMSRILFHATKVVLEEDGLSVPTADEVVAWRQEQARRKQGTA